MRAVWFAMAAALVLCGPGCSDTLDLTTDASCGAGGCADAGDAAPAVDAGRDAAVPFDAALPDACVGSMTDPLNCGSCGHVCPGGAHATASCTAGECGLACEVGRGDCDALVATGCEARVVTGGSCATRICAATGYDGPVELTTAGDLELQGQYVRDIDGDGHLDVITVDQLAERIVVYAGDGAGHFAPGVVTVTGRNHGDAAFGDFDADGFLDVVLSQADDLRLYVLLGSATGFTPGNPVMQPGTPRAIQALDYDHDGDVDLVVWLGAATSTCLAVALNDGTGDFTTGTCVLTSSLGFYNPVMATLDWDGDGFEDLAEAVTVGGFVVVRRSTSGFPELTRIAITGLGPQENIELQAIDLDADGYRDLALIAPGVTPEPVRVHGYAVPTGAELCADMVLPATATAPATFANANPLGDFDEDGYIDWITRVRPVVGPEQVFLSH